MILNLVQKDIPRRSLPQLIADLASWNVTVHRTQLTGQH